MFWSMDSDDFKGNHCDQGKCPPVNSVKKVFESMSNVKIMKLKQHYYYFYDHHHYFNYSYFVIRLF